MPTVGLWPTQWTSSSMAARTRRQKLRSEEHTSELQSHHDLHSFPTRRSSDLQRAAELFPGPDDGSPDQVGAELHRVVDDPQLPTQLEYPAALGCGCQRSVCGPRNGRRLRWRRVRGDKN